MFLNQWQFQLEKHSRYQFIRKIFSDLLPGGDGIESDVSVKAGRSSGKSSANSVREESSLSITRKLKIKNIFAFLLSLNLLFN